MRVPLLDLRAQYGALRSAVESEILAVCEAQQFVLGPRVAALESRIAAYSGTDAGIGVSSGTDALLVALMALGIGPGDEVITTPFTFFATAGVIARLNARPVFCDIEPGTFNLSPAAVAEFLETACEPGTDGPVNRTTGGRVRAIMPVHLYGQMADMDAFVALARRYRLSIVEDAAQAIGAELADGRRAGSIGDIGCFSFFPSKNLGAFGDGGMCVTSDPALAGTLKAMRVHGSLQRYYHASVGGNFRLDELQAAVLLIKLDRLDEWSQARQRNARRYAELFDAAGLATTVRLPEILPGRHIFNQFVIRVPQRDALRAHLTAHEIGTEIYYPLPLHEQACFAYLGYRTGELPNAEAASGETLALPIYPELDASQLEYVVEQVKSFYRDNPV